MRFDRSVGPRAVRVPHRDFSNAAESGGLCGGLLAVSQAVRVNKYVWAAGSGYGVIAVLFNPIVPVCLSPSALLWVNAICLMTFLISLGTLERESRLSALPDKSDAGKLASVHV